MTVEEWIEAYAREAGGEPPTPGEIEALLELASVAAHSSERRAAPIACWIAGRAGIDPAEARRLADRVSESSK